MSASYTINWDADEVGKYGSIVLACEAGDILKYFDYGDMIDITFPGKGSVRLPLCGDYDDVSPGELVLRVNKSSNNAILAINYGQFGVMEGFLEATPESEDVNYRPVGELPSEVTFTLAEKGTYSDMIQIGHLSLSADRELYPDLSDEEFCNFRSIVCGNISPGKLYRSSSPIDDEYGRNTYADAMTEKYGIRTIINMSNSEENAKALAGFEGSYYSTADIRYMSMALSLGTSDFNDHIADCLRVMAEEDGGPYLIHCVYGKDRTGFLCDRKGDP